AQLREHAVPGFFAWRRIFGGKQDRPSPLASESQTLPETKYSQQNGRCNTDGLVRWQQADGYCGWPHRHECGYQGSLAAHAVAKMPEQCRAQRPGKKSQRESCQRFKGCGCRVSGGKEKLRKYQHRRRGVDIKIKKLDRCADQAGGQYPARRVARVVFLTHKVYGSNIGYSG